MKEKDTFVQTLRILRENAINYLYRVLNRRGSGYQLIDPDEYAEGFDGSEPPSSNVKILGLPRFTVENIGYAAVILNLDEGFIIVEGISVDGGDEETKRNLQMLSTDTICQIASLVEQLEN